MVTLLITNLLFETDSATLRHFVGQVAPVQRIRFLMRSDGRHRGTAFIDVKNEDVEKVISELNEKELDGRRLLIKVAKSQTRKG